MKAAGYKICLILVVVFMAILITGCKVRYRSDVPITKEEANEMAFCILPLPENASNIRFSLSGTTQEWDYFAVCDAPMEDIEVFIREQYEEQNRWGRGQNLGLRVEKLPLREKESFFRRVVMRPFPWWRPDEIEEGYYKYSANHPTQTPSFWVDTKNSRIFIKSYW